MIFLKPAAPAKACGKVGRPHWCRLHWPLPLGTVRKPREGAVLMAGSSEPAEGSLEVSHRPKQPSSHPTMQLLPRWLAAPCLPPGCYEDPVNEKSTTRIQKWAFLWRVVPKDCCQQFLSSLDVHATPHMERRGLPQPESVLAL